MKKIQTKKIPGLSRSNSEKPNNCTQEAIPDSEWLLKEVVINKLKQP